MVLTSPLVNLSAPPGRPVGQLYPGIQEQRDTWIRNMTEHPDLPLNVGVPILIDRGDLTAVAPLWLQQTARLRQFGLPSDSWTAEMYGYMIGAADLGLRHQTWDVACGPLLHYTTGNCGLRWHKSKYRPWEAVEVEPGLAPAVAEMGLILNEYAAQRRQG